MVGMERDEQTTRVSSGGSEDTSLDEDRDRPHLGENTSDHVHNTAISPFVNGFDRENSDLRNRVEELCNDGGLNGNNLNLEQSENCQREIFVTKCDLNFKLVNSGCTNDSHANTENSGHNNFGALSSDRQQSFMDYVNLDNLERAKETDQLNGVDETPPFWRLGDDQWRNEEVFQGSCPRNSLRRESDTRDHYVLMRASKDRGRQVEKSSQEEQRRNALRKDGDWNDFDRLIFPSQPLPFPPQKRSNGNLNMMTPPPKVLPSLPPRKPSLPLLMQTISPLSSANLQSPISNFYGNIGEKIVPAAVASPGTKKVVSTDVDYIIMDRSNYFDYEKNSFSTAVTPQESRSAEDLLGSAGESNTEEENKDYGWLDRRVSRPKTTSNSSGYMDMSFNKRPEGEGDGRGGDLSKEKSEVEKRLSSIDELPGFPLLKDLTPNQQKIRHLRHSRSLDDELLPSDESETFLNTKVATPDEGLSGKICLEKAATINTVPKHWKPFDDYLTSRFRESGVDDAKVYVDSSTLRLGIPRGNDVIARYVELSVGEKRKRSFLSRLVRRHAKEKTGVASSVGSDSAQRHHKTVKVNNCIISTASVVITSNPTNNSPRKLVAESNAEFRTARKGSLGSQEAFQGSSPRSTSGVGGGGGKTSYLKMLFGKSGGGSSGSSSHPAVAVSPPPSKGLLISLETAIDSTRPPLPPHRNSNGNCLDETSSQVLPQPQRVFRPLPPVPLVTAAMGSSPIQRVHSSPSKFAVLAEFFSFRRHSGAGLMATNSSSSSFNGVANVQGGKDSSSKQRHQKNSDKNSDINSDIKLLKYTRSNDIVIRDVTPSPPLLPRKMHQKLILVKHGEQDGFNLPVPGVRETLGQAKSSSCSLYINSQGARDSGVELGGTSTSRNLNWDTFPRRATSRDDHVSGSMPPNSFDGIVGNDCPLPQLSTNNVTGPRLLSPGLSNGSFSETGSMSPSSSVLSRESIASAADCDGGSSLAVPSLLSSTETLSASPSINSSNVNTFSYDPVESDGNFDAERQKKLVCAIEQ